MRGPPKRFNPHPFVYHEELDLEIETLTNLGKGLGRAGDWVVMAPFSLPGEKVRVRIFRNYKNYSEADLLKVLEPSPCRVEPHCPLFGACGGCQYQHLDYKEQLKWKQRQVEELLESLAEAKIPVNPVRPSPKQYGYRSKITPHFQRPRQAQALKIGFQHWSSRQLVDVPQCPLATEDINQALAEERKNIRSHSRQYRKGKTLLLREALEGVVSDPNAIISEQVGQQIFQFQAGTFFQNNPFLLPEMVAYVTEEAQGEGIRFLLDVYCGVGVFSLAASAFFERCLGIEISPQSIHWANANALINKISNCHFFVGEAAALFSRVDSDPDQTSIILDPPRKGCEQSLLRQLWAFRPRQVVYVSCDPATQARDIRQFLNEGYTVARVQPFDLFPQTRHIENIVTLKRV